MATTERDVRQSQGRRSTTMLRACGVEGCGTLTLGGPCIVHDVVERPAFLRGRPYLASAAEIESLELAFAD